MNLIYFVRHGETEWNHSGRYQGFTDIPLNAVGLEQARLCAEALKNVELDRIIVSDLSRAVVTAETIAEGRNIQVQQDKRLREINFGDWESLTYNQIDQRWPGIIEEMYRHPADVQISGGESFHEVQVRAWAALEETLSAAQEDEKIMVVCHGGTIRTLLCRLLDMSLNHCWNFSLGNTAISCVKFFGNEPDSHNILALLNDLRHIREQSCV